MYIGLRSIFDGRDNVKIPNRKKVQWIQPTEKLPIMELMHNETSRPPRGIRTIDVAHGTVFRSNLSQIVYVVVERSENEANMPGYTQIRQNTHNETDRGALIYFNMFMRSSGTLNRYPFFSTSSIFFFVLSGPNSGALRADFRRAFRGGAEEAISGCRLR